MVDWPDSPPRDKALVSFLHDHNIGSKWATMDQSDDIFEMNGVPFWLNDDSNFAHDDATASFPGAADLDLQVDQEVQFDHEHNMPLPLHPEFCARGPFEPKRMERPSNTRTMAPAFTEPRARPGKSMEEEKGGSPGLEESVPSRLARYGKSCDISLVQRVSQSGLRARKKRGVMVDDGGLLDPHNLSSNIAIKPILEEAEFPQESRKQPVAPQQSEDFERDPLPSIVMCVGTAAPGQVERVSLLAKLRSTAAQKYKGNVFAEVHTRGDVVMSIFKWLSVTEQFSFVTSQASAHNFELSHNCYVPNSMVLQRWMVIENPLRFCDETTVAAPASQEAKHDKSATTTATTTRKRKKTKPRKHTMMSASHEALEQARMYLSTFQRKKAKDSLPRVKSAFAVSMIFDCKAHNYAAVYEKLQILEVSAQIEPACITYHIFMRQGEADGAVMRPPFPQRDTSFLIYAVYKDPTGFQNHMQQDYSLLHSFGNGFPVHNLDLQVWKRMDPYC